jgi:CBS domain-containing membrane protein
MGTTTRTTTTRKIVPPPPTAPVPRGRRIERQVRDLMTERVFTLRENDRLLDLEELMSSHHVRHVPIVDRDGELVGLVTHRDLARGVLGRLDDVPIGVEEDILRRRRIGEIMVTDPDTIEPDTPLREAAETMLENKIGCLPVTEGTRLVGILTEADFVRDYLERG